MGNELLRRLQNKKKMWTTPKHPIYFQSIEFKIIYAAGVFIHAGLHKKVNTLNNFELERLLTKGLDFNQKEKAQVIRVARNEQKAIDAVIRLLTTPVMKELFLMDLISVSMGSDMMSNEEKESIGLFAELFHISHKQVKLLEQFAVAAFLHDKNRAKKIMNEMPKNGISCTIAELKYYISDVDYVTKIDHTVFTKSSMVKLYDQCEIKDDIIVGNGQTLIISNAVVAMYGSIILDGGIVQIRNSQLRKRNFSCQPLIQSKSYSQLDIVDGNFWCKGCCSAVVMEHGQLFFKDSNIRETLGSAVIFRGDKFKIENVYFEHCLSNQNGGAVCIENETGQIKGCSFYDCQGKLGGAIYTKNGIEILDCIFNFCKALEYGGVIFYEGEIEEKIRNCYYTHCYPRGEEIIQHIIGKSEKIIDKEYNIIWNTLLEQTVFVSEKGTLRMDGAFVYLMCPIVCRGTLEIRHSKVKGLQINGRDMFLLEWARGATIEYSEFDGNLQYGIFRASGTRLKMESCIIRNTAGGRGVFDAYTSIIENCIFSFCQKGGIYCQGGKIRNCQFINCRGKSGAGIIVYGGNGQIENCMFVRCISTYSGGGIDSTGRCIIKDCTFEECKPDNMT
ncbi:right-handed parallel beta-helix repeat-containing protein [Velocimicrobium porci]|nr:right-handed parallel beta-helix repeat-containing protein [Velocimicrobium porci]